MNSSVPNTTVAIVGAGPIGLEMAVALRRRNIAFEIFDAGSIGHTISWWAPQTRWFSSNERIAIAGVPLNTIDQSKCSREQYLTYLRSVADQYDIRIGTFMRVVDIRRLAEDQIIAADYSGDDSQSLEISFEAHSAASRDISTIGSRLRASAVVLAVGGTDSPNQLAIPGEDLPHVDGYLRETHRYYGRKVTIIGGRNSAVEAALRLHHVGASVTLAYRGSELPADHIKYWLIPEIQGLIKAGRIRALFDAQPLEITDQFVKFRCGNGTTRKIQSDSVLSLIGYRQDKMLLRQAGVELLGDGQRPFHDPETMQTNVPGVYVAGTAVAGTQSSSYKLFLENCHTHVDRILNHLLDNQTGDGSADEPQPISRGHHAGLESLIDSQPES